MDERLEKAFAIANYMTTLSNQRRIIAEEFDQSIVYYINGGTFKISPELITFTKSMIDLGHAYDVPFIDVNGFPVVVPDVQKFFDEILLQYMTALNQYSIKFADLKSKRKIADLVDL
jgi:hypothetical protein